MRRRKDSSNTKQTGDAAEAQAETFLQAQGLRSIERNFSCKLGEIDLIMQHQEFLVFIEVRFRRDTRFGGAIQSISEKKQSRIRNTAIVYLQQKNLYEKQAHRFDVVAISENDTQWIQGAF